MTVKEHQLSNAGRNVIDDGLLQNIRNLNPQQLSWLSGYCAALLDYQSDSQNSSLPTSFSVSAQPLSTDTLSTSKPILVLYASQTGNAQAIAEKLYGALSNKQLEVVLKSTLDVSIKELSNYSTILLAASTHGEGEPPDDAMDLHESLMSKKTTSKKFSLQGIGFAVLGLGDSSYEFFCQTAKDFAQGFAKLGADELIDTVLCDVDYQPLAQEWVDKTTAAVSAWLAKDNLGGNSLEENSLAEKGLVHNKLQNSLSETAVVYDKDNPAKAVISTIQRITGKGSPKETYHLEIDISDSELSYEPGDAIGVIAHNRETLVDEILGLLNLPGDVQINYQNQTLSLKEFLTQKAELTLINKASIKGLLELEPNDELRIIYDTGYSEFITNHQFVDLLHIAKPNLSAQQLVDLLKPIKPRLYSISSSQEKVEDEVHLTLNHVFAQSSYGERFGLASHFLTQQLSEDQSVSIFVEKNPKFKLPPADEPIIMVGPGTGIAPFRSFLQHREATQNSGKNWLLFGNPHFNTDFLYQVEIQKYVSTGLLDKLSLAFSRDSDNKVYVQHKLLENSAEVWQWLEQGAYFYVCGDMHHMAKDVEQALLTIIQEQGNHSEQDAKDYLKTLKQNQRYQRDIY